jgi:hypothetical protein
MKKPPMSLITATKCTVIYTSSRVHDPRLEYAGKIYSKTPNTRMTSTDGLSNYDAHGKLASDLKYSKLRVCCGPCVSRVVLFSFVPTVSLKLV